MTVNLGPDLLEARKRRINVRKKGRSGEQEVATLFRGWVEEVRETLGWEAERMPAIKRNQMQTAGMHRGEGQGDIVGIDWLSVEVKRVENDNKSNMSSWWEQAKSQAARGAEPVLFWRLNGSQWNVKLYGWLALPNDRRVRAPVVITDSIFAVWFKERLKFELRRGV